MRVGLMAGLALVLIPAPCLAWGNQGHQIICALAEDLMAPPTRERLRSILEAGFTDGTAADLALACTWPDRVRNDPEYRVWRPHHAIRVPTNADRVDPVAHCPESRCLLGGLEHFSRELREQTDSRRRAEALLYVAHFAGDAHQPLHVSHPDGTGGSHTVVGFWRPGAEPEPMDLHYLWDSAILARRTGGRWRAYARELAALLSSTDPSRWSSTRPLDWLDESLGLARRHTDDLGPGAVIDRAAYERALGVMSLQLRKAGVRVAALLDALLSGEDRG